MFKHTLVARKISIFCWVPFVSCNHMQKVRQSFNEISAMMVSMILQLIAIIHLNLRPSVVLIETTCSLNCI